MNVLKKSALICMIGTLCTINTTVKAQESDSDGGPTVIKSSFDFERLSGMYGRMKPHGNDLMGDMIDKKTGGLQFEHTDVSIPGNSGLEVALRRKIVTGSKRPSQYQQAFGNWVLDLPVAYFGYAYDSSTTHPTFNGGCVQSYGNIDSTLSQGTARASTQVEKDGHRVGLILNVPGKQLSGFASAHPSGGIMDSTSDWISGGQETDYEGRCAQVTVAPDGTKYKFGRNTLRTAKPLDTPAFTTIAGGPDFGPVFIGYRWYRFEKKHAVQLITEVEDVHGNWVRYEYNDDKELTRIYSNDGREINIHYGTLGSAGNFNSRKISHITAHGRTWSYGYQNDYALKTVTLPDGRFWEFGTSQNADDQVSPMSAMDFDPYLHTTCEPMNRSFSMKHPDGATGSFTLRDTQLLASTLTEDVADEYALDIGEDTVWGPLERTGNFETSSNICYGGSTSNSYNPARSYAVYNARSVVEKKITAPNIPDAIWSFEYGGPVGSVKDRTQTRITEPDNTVRAYTYHSFGSDHGLLAQLDVSSPSGAGESFVYEYDLTQGYPDYCGYGDDRMGSCLLYAKRPQTKVTHTRDGVTYTTENQYDKDADGTLMDLGKPNRITRYSTLQSEQRISDIQYWYNTNANIIGLPEVITRNGKQFVRNTYNALGLRTSIDWLENDWESFTYHADGTLQTIEDPLGFIATLDNYHRGQAQLITRRDGTTLQRTVDDNGWVTSETNARNYSIGYEYNDAGWMTYIDHPAPWSDTEIAYHNLGGDDFYRSIRKGTKQTVERFDNMLRLRSMEQHTLFGDAASIYIATDYDALGRTVFASQPSALPNSTQGTQTTYDGLSRVTQTRENFGLNVTTTVAYLSGNRTQTTDALGHQTISTKSGYASPSDGTVTLIEQPEGVDTAMTYDIYGNILTATQSGDTYNNLSATQRWSYDQRFRVCRHHTPETGSKLYEYDNANQVVAYGEGVSGTTGCGVIPAADRIVKNYDKLGRDKLINYPDSTPDIELDYDENGNLTRNTRGSVVWNYVYDLADHLTSESMSIDGRTFALSYGYDASSNLISRTLPSGRDVVYNYDGLNRVNQVESEGQNYATGIDYHASSMITSMTYGNGQVFTQTPNDRLLPERITAEHGTTVAMDLQYSYDQRGKIIQITDWANRSLDRQMDYDDLGRLSVADGAWGAGTFDYDPLGNIRQKQLGSRTVGVSYDANNRATQSTDTAGSTRAIEYDSRGNVIKLGTLNFTYDKSNQPTALSGSSTGSYTYDGKLKRVKVEVDGKVIYNVFDAAGSLVHIDEMDAEALTVCFTNCNSVGVPKATDYIRANGMTIARLENGLPTYLHPDHLGSPVAATDELGNIKWQEHYTPFGEKWLQDAANDDQMSFTGHIADSATGLTYMQARYYDPVIGRFLSNDPVGFNDHVTGLQGAQGFNRYAYVNNDPYKYTDPNGEFLNFAVKFVADVALGVAIQAATGQPINVGAAVKESAQGILNPAKTVAKVAKLAKALNKSRKANKANKANKTCCFVAGTQVLTQSGYKNIEDVTLGEKLWAKDIETGEQGWKPVIKVFIEPDRGIYEIKLIGTDGFEQKIQATDDHPFYVIGKGWKATVELEAGDQIETDGSGAMTVVGVIDEQREDLTYNFTVADFHTYYVTERNVLVHNCGINMKDEHIPGAARVDGDPSKAVNQAGYDKAQLECAKCKLETSLKNRRAEQKRKGPDAGHARKIKAEQKQLDKVNKRLKEAE